VKKDTRIRIEAKMLILSLGLIFVPCINGAFSEENTKTIPKENIFEFASSRNMLTGDYDDKRGFWDKRGYGDKRSSDSLADNVIQEIDCEEFPGVCLFHLMGKNEEIRNSRAGLFFDKRGYGDKKRGFWDKRGFGNRREIYDKRMGRFYPYMFLPNNS
jgi:hypothetical protein